MMQVKAAYKMPKKADVLNTLLELNLKLAGVEGAGKSIVWTGRSASCKG